LLLASTLALGLAVLAGTSQVPYVALTPGPVFNTLGSVGQTPVLSITGHATYPAQGALDLTTVSVRSKMTLFEAIVGWFNPHESVIPREVVFPPNQTQQQADQQNTQQMLESQDAATTAAMTQLGLVQTAVASVTAKGPAAGKLKPGDVITTVDGHKVTDATSLRNLITARKPGAPVVIGFLRAGKAGTVTLTTVASTDQPRRPIVGVATKETFPIKVTIQLKDVGGPSAGLMFALGILEKLGPDSLTGGKHIAGTGLITADGKVGPIGGIPQKLLGARQDGATVFLAPADNCAEAKANKPSGLTLVKVSTLKGALDALATVRAGGTPPSC
jgi:PDZ domain-containing protein